MLNFQFKVLFIYSFIYIRVSNSGSMLALGSTEINASTVSKNEKK